MPSEAEGRALALATYGQLQAKVDAKFSEIYQQHVGHFSCSKGCHQCCLPGLTVNRLEAAALAAALLQKPQLVADLEALAVLDPHAGTRCAMLGQDGACLVYEARPLVRRSHGAPLKVTASQLDACFLNFTELSLETLPAADFINLETLNTLLALLVRQFDPEAAPEARVRLRLPDLLAAAKNLAAPPSSL